MPTFEKIRERAAKRKGGEAVLQSLLGPTAGQCRAGQGA